MEIEMFYIKILNIHNSEWNLLNLEYLVKVIIILKYIYWLGCSNYH